MGALGLRQRLAALVASVHEKDLTSPFSKNIHRDPRRTARPEDESDPRIPLLLLSLLRSIFDHGLERLAIRVLPAQPERLARAARPQQRVDRPLAVLVRARKERGLLLERDRHGRADERESEGVERGDEGFELPPERAHRERYVERVEAERLEVRVVEGGREGVRDDTSQEPEEPGHLSRPGHAVDLREVAGEELPRRRGAPGKKRAIRERRAEIRRERAGCDAGLSHAEGRETPVPVGGLKLEEAAGIAGIVRRRDEFHEPGRRREHPGDERAHDRPGCLPCHAERESSWKGEWPGRRLPRRGGTRRRRIQTRPREPSKAASAPPLRWPRKAPPSDAERTVAMSVLPSKHARSAGNSGSSDISSRRSSTAAEGGRSTSSRARLQRLGVRSPARRRRRGACFPRSGPKRKPPPVRRGLGECYPEKPARLRTTMGRRRKARPAQL